MPNPHDFVIPEEDRPFVSMALVTYAATLRRACDEFPGVPEAGVALNKAASHAMYLAQAMNPPIRDYGQVPGMGIITGLTYPRENQGEVNPHQTSS
jgi:hypothetical protein